MQRLAEQRYQPAVPLLAMAVVVGARGPGGAPVEGRHLEAGPAAGRLGGARIELDLVVRLEVVRRREPVRDAVEEGVDRGAALVAAELAELEHPVVGEQR